MREVGPLTVDGLLGGGKLIDGLATSLAALLAFGDAASSLSDAILSLAIRTGVLDCQPISRDPSAVIHQP